MEICFSAIYDKSTPFCSGSLGLFSSWPALMLHVTHLIFALSRRMGRSLVTAQLPRLWLRPRPGEGGESMGQVT